MPDRETNPATAEKDKVSSAIHGYIHTFVFLKNANRANIYSLLYVFIIHTYIHTYNLSSIHTYIHTYIHT